MNSKYYTLIYCLMLLFPFGGLMAQNMELEVRGTILDNESMAPVPYATITMNSVEDQNLIGGTTSDINGNFSFLSDQPDVYFEVSYIGYQTQSIKEFNVVGDRPVQAALMIKTDSKLFGGSGQINIVVLGVEKCVYSVFGNSNYGRFSSDTGQPQYIYYFVVRCQDGISFEPSDSGPVFLVIGQPL